MEKLELLLVVRWCRDFAAACAKTISVGDRGSS
jgi:hypothetical protein